MQETMDSSRRWSGYVCPDCRFVFRVPRDHDGQGVVCPSCRRMLKIPAAGDRPPPLVASLRVTPAEEPVVLPQERKRSRRRRSKKSRHQSAHEWDSSSGKTSRGLSLHVEKRQMFWMLVGGVALFAAIVAGVLIANRSKSATAPAAGSLAADKSKAARPPIAERADVAILAEAEPLTKKFLAATRIEDLLPLVRHPELSLARMRDYYPKGIINPPGLAEFNINSAIVREGAFFFVNVRTGSFDEKSIAYADSKDGLKIDWESWVGWSAMPWDEFLKTKPITARIFRVRINQIDYYNFAFSDDKKWQSYRLVSPDGSHSLYGYVERGSAACAKLSHPTDEPADIRQVPSILSLKFPPKAVSANQVLIEDLVAEGWVLENEPSP